LAHADLSRYDFRCRVVGAGVLGLLAASYRTQRRHDWRSLFPAIVIAVLVTSCQFPYSRPAGGCWRTVSRVLDGDTIVLENGERVRLISVDTPEAVHPNKSVEYFGREASAFTKRMVEGKRVRLEYDPAYAHRGNKDNTPERRTLAYLFLEDGTDVNAEIIGVAS
jgi:micrococcal nuclease